MSEVTSGSPRLQDGGAWLGLLREPPAFLPTWPLHLPRQPQGRLACHRLYGPVPSSWPARFPSSPLLGPAREVSASPGRTCLGQGCPGNLCIFLSTGSGLQLNVQNAFAAAAASACGRPSQGPATPPSQPGHVARPRPPCGPAHRATAGSEVLSPPGLRPLAIIPSGAGSTRPSPCSAHFPFLTTRMPPQRTRVSAHARQERWSQHRGPRCPYLGTVFPVVPRCQEGRASTRQSAGARPGCRTAPPEVGKGTAGSGPARPAAVRPEYAERDHPPARGRGVPARPPPPAGLAPVSTCTRFSEGRCAVKPEASARAWATRVRSAHAPFERGPSPRSPVPRGRE